VLDVKPEEIKPDEKLEDGLGVDSTEMVEISVGLKKVLSIEIGDNELKKSHSFNEIVEILKSKGAN
ncbi:MAG: acyl carrier protein, partial [Candidatus Aenigmarchaeota archaeon]|nr:acyl carrier protein [Candidatus Aenigmarchaeota archaeon]